MEVRMEAVLVGALTAVAAVVSVVLWRSLTRLPADLPLARDPGEQVQWRRHYRSTVGTLRWAAAMIVFLLGFLTGMALIFLKATAPG